MQYAAERAPLPTSSIRVVRVASFTAGIVPSLVGLVIKGETKDEIRGGQIWAGLCSHIFHSLGSMQFTRHGNAHEYDAGIWKYGSWRFYINAMVYELSRSIYWADCLGFCRRNFRLARSLRLQQIALIKNFY